MDGRPAMMDAWPPSMIDSWKRKGGACPWGPGPGPRRSTHTPHIVQSPYILRKISFRPFNKFNDTNKDHNDLRYEKSVIVSQHARVNEPRLDPHFEKTYEKKSLHLGANSFIASV